MKETRNQRLETHRPADGPEKAWDQGQGKGAGAARGRQTLLKKHFPMIRSREEILSMIRSEKNLKDLFQQWSEMEQEDFLDCCTGARGMKVLYDGIFKEIFNPEITPERLEKLLSLILGKQVKIKTVLPNDSVRLGAESSLLYTDIGVGKENVNLDGRDWPENREKSGSDKIWDPICL